MANKEVKNSSTGAMDTEAALRTRYEKMETAYGVINVNGTYPDVKLGDVAILSQIPSKTLITARFVSNAATPDVLELFTPLPTSDSPIAWVVDKSATKISYVVKYIRGTGHDGLGLQSDGQKGIKLAIAVNTIAPVVTYPSGPTIGTTTATLKSSVQPEGANTVVTFEYGTTTAYGTTVAAVGSPIADGVTAVTPVTAAITGLVTATAYHFRANATNSAGTTHGADQTFTTN